MSIDSHEVVPQIVLSACVVIVACGVLIPDPRKASWRVQGQHRPERVQSSLSAARCPSQDERPGLGRVAIQAMLDPIRATTCGKKKKVNGNRSPIVCDRASPTPIIDIATMSAFRGRGSLALE